LNYINILGSKSNLITAQWNGYNILHTAASRVAGLDMKFLPGDKGLGTKQIIEASKSGDIETLFLLGADELETSSLKETFVIYQGSHGDASAHVADIILPGASYAEKSGIYVNLEGRVQLGMPAVNPKGQAKEDWSIIRALSGHLRKVLPYDNLDALRSKLFQDHPSFSGIGYIEKPANSNNLDFLPQKVIKDSEDVPFINPICDFYMTNPILRASNVMAECSSIADSLDMTEAAE
jgi:NADH-quinone oxidoreductase subunit G